MKVFLVDDDDAIRRLVGRVLEQRGHAVFSSDTPYGVSALILRHRPDLVLIDVRMPGLSGPDLCKIIAELSLDFPPRIVLWSALDEHALQAAARDAGDLPWISKLAGPTQIADAIESHGRGSNPRAPATGARARGRNRS